MHVNRNYIILSVIPIILLSGILPTFATPGGLIPEYRGAVDTIGNLYILDSDNGFVQKFDSLGNFVSVFPIEIPNTDDPIFIYAFEINSKNKIYFLSMDNDIHIFDSDGIFEGSFQVKSQMTNDASPHDNIAIDQSDNMYVLDYQTQVIEKFDQFGRFIKNIEKPNAEDTFEYLGNEIAVDKNDLLYTAEFPTLKINGSSFTESRIWKFQENTLEKIISKNSSIGFDKIEIDSQNNIYGKERVTVEKYNPSGKLLFSIGDAEDVDFTYIVDIVVNENDDLYVIDSLDSGVRKFDSDGQYISKINLVTDYENLDDYLANEQPDDILIDVVPNLSDDLLYVFPDWIQKVRSWYDDDLISQADMQSFYDYLNSENIIQDNISFNPESGKFETTEQPSKSNDILVIRTGWWSAYCFGRCNADMTLTVETIVYHSDVGPHSSSECLEISKELSFSEQEWDSLIDLIDVEKFNELPNVIGSPGATDGPIVHIEIANGEKSKTVSFERPSELSGNEEFAQALEDTLYDLNSKYSDNCLVD